MYGQSNLSSQLCLLVQQQAAEFNAIKNMSSLQQLAGLGNFIKREKTYKDDIKDMEQEIKNYLYGEETITF